MDNLKDEPFILFKESAYNWKLILDECEKHGFTPNIVLSSDQIETMRGLVSKGVGICFLIEEIACKSEDIVAIPLKDPLYIDFGVAWKKNICRKQHKHLFNSSAKFVFLVNSETKHSSN